MKTRNQILTCAIALTICVSLPSALHGQSHWHQQFPEYYGAMPSAGADMWDSLHCIIVAPRNIWRTSDAGATWEMVHDSLPNVNCVQYVTANVLCAADSGIVRSTDNGTTWSRVVPYSAIMTVQVIDSEFAVAMRVDADTTQLLYSIDRGLTWAPRAAALPMALSDVRFVNRRAGFGMAAQFVFVKTTDGGAHWTQMPFDSSYVVQSFNFFDASTGIFNDGTSSLMYRTTDGGDHWATGDTARHLNCNTIRYIDSVALVCSGYGEVWYSIDAGASWTYSYADPFRAILAVTRTAHKSLMLIGHDTYSNAGMAWRSDDAGQSWQLAFDGSVNFTAVAYATDSVLAAVGDDGEILRTSDAGAHWKRAAYNSSGGFNAVAFASATRGAAVGQARTALYTTDAGQHWRPASPTPVDPINAISFWDSAAGLAVGYYGGVSRTTDGGKSWSSLRLDSVSALYGVACLDRNVAVAIGEWIGLYVLALCRTTDGGATWSVQKRTEILNNVGFAFASATTGVISSPGFFPRYGGGDPNVYLRTTNGGIDWYDASVGGLFTAGDRVCFSDSVNGYGQDNMFGGISKTTNAGISWVGTVDGPGRWMNAIAARGQSATSVGEYGGIWRTNDGGGSIVRNVTVAPHHLDFGDITLGYPITDSVRITNGGVDTLQVTTDGDFPNRISVAPGTSRFLKIYFYSARDTGVHVGATHLWANADLLGDSITWTYRSVGPVLGFNPNYLDFGTVRPGDTVARTLFISNDGNALLRFWQAEVLNAQSQHDTRFVVDPTNDSVSAGDSVRVVVTFYPDAAPLGNCLFHFSQTNGQGAMTVLANVVGVREDRAAPGALQLEPAYPNPFTQTTALAFSVASSQHVDLSILTIDGRVVETLLDAQVDAGRHTLEWPSRKVPSGVYVCRLNTAAGVVARILIKSE